MSTWRRIRFFFSVGSLALMLAAAAAASCSALPETDAGGETLEPVAESAAAAEESAVDIAIEGLEIANARRPLPGLLTAGQLTPEQYTALEELGFRNFINLRTEGESGTGWEEERTSDGHYVRIPVQGAAGLTRENVDRLAEALENAGDEPTVLYCGSSNRVGALLALKAFWLDGADPETALELGRAGGMTRLESKVEEILQADGSH